MKFLWVGVFLAQSVVVSPYSPPKEANVLATTFVDWDSLVEKATPVGKIRRVFDNPTPYLDKLEVHITTLNPGAESHPVHKHPWEEMLLIKDGDFEVTVNGHKEHAGPGLWCFWLPMIRTMHATPGPRREPTT